MSTRTRTSTMRAVARRVLVGLLATVAALTLLAGPALATEGGGHGEREKITMPESERDRVGLILLGLTGLGALLALENARRQLKGERDQATGKWRWR